MDEYGSTGSGDSGEESDQSSGRFGRAKEFASTQYNRVRERVEDVDFGAITDQVRAYVRSNPGKALLLSVGLGFVIGMMLRSDDDDD